MTQDGGLYDGGPGIENARREGPGMEDTGRGGDGWGQSEGS